LVVLKICLLGLVVVCSRIDLDSVLGIVFVSGDIALDLDWI
jgi:hypothetical protein